MEMQKKGSAVCPKCGKVIERIIPFPLLDGTHRFVNKTVRVACDCDVAEREAIDRRMEHEERMREIEKLRSLSLMDEKLKDVTFSKCQVTEDNRKALGIAKRYAERFDEMHKMHQGLLFWGNVGTGKSYIAAAIANELLNRNVPVVMTSFVKLLNEMQGFGSDAGTHIEKINTAKLLVIDDLGSERGTDYTLEKVYDIVDSRYRAGKPVIMTTNLTMQQMKECTDIRYNRIYDRIFEMCYPVYVPGRSWRKKEAVSRFDRMKELLEV